MKMKVVFSAMSMVLALAGSAQAASISSGDTIKLDWSSAGDADGGSLADWNQTDDGSATIASGSVIRHGDGAVVDDASISFANFGAGNFNNDAGAANPTFLGVDPFLILAADDIYFHGSSSDLTTTFSGLDANLTYDVRVYNSISGGGHNNTTDVNGTSVNTTSGTVYASATLEAAGLVFTGISPTVGGDIVITISGDDSYPLQAMTITAVPEPGSFCLASIALGGLGLVGRRRRRR